MKPISRAILLGLAITATLGCGELVEDDPDAAIIDNTDDTDKAPLSAKVSIPEGAAIPGCETTDECYLPAIVEVRVGGEVTWSNNDTAAHTITHGTPSEGLLGEFDSGLVLDGEAVYAYTFDTAGEFPYYCQVHPWMEGTIKVKE